MREIEPVAVTSGEFGQVVWRVLPVFGTETPMYIIPDTHRIVPVDLLADACCFLSKGYISAEVSEKLLAIIDEEEST